MAWLAVTKNGEEVYNLEPFKYNGEWIPDPLYDDHSVILPNGTIKKLIGKDLKYGDDPVEYD